MYGAHVQANGIRHHYLDYGTVGTPVLLIPGITAPAMTWGFVAERLANTNRILVLDLRGRGLSENRPGLSYTLDDYAQDAQGVIAALGLDRPIVLGHSLGARIAARLAATAPNLLSKLVLADPPLSGPGRKPYVTPLEPYLRAIEFAGRGASVDEFRQFNPTWTHEQLRSRMQWLPSCSIEAVTVSHRNFQTEDIYPDFPKITCPTLFVYAGNATVVSDADAAEIERLIPNARVARVAAGHMIPWDNLDDFLKVVVPFMSSRGAETGLPRQVSNRPHGGFAE